MPLLTARAAVGQVAEPLAVAQALDATWNRHDLDAVVAAFAPDAVVRQASSVVGASADDAVVDDVYGARLQLEGGTAIPAIEGDDVVWRGHESIRAWARR